MNLVWKWIISSIFWGESVYNYICKYCGAHLDPSEKCDCDLSDVVEQDVDCEDYIDKRWSEYCYN